MYMSMLQHANEDVEKMILGNKCDMEDKRQVGKDRGDSVSVIIFCPTGFAWFCYSGRPFSASEAKVLSLLE